MPVRIVGGGPAGCEAAWQGARRGFVVELWKMRPGRGTEAYVTDRLAELVFSNSFRSDDAERNAVGLLHEERRRADSLVMAAADRHKVPAGGALAVAHAGFAEAVHRAIEKAPRIRVRRAEAAALPGPEGGPAIVATGPLTAPAPSQAIRTLAGTDSLALFDAIAPIVHRDSVDLGPPGPVPLRQARARRRPRDLSQLPVRPGALRGVYRRLARGRHRALPGLGTRHALFRGLPAARCHDPARPRDLALRPHAAGRPDRTSLDSPALLDARLRLRRAPHLRFAGQITGVEGYVESAAIGLLAGRFAATERAGDADRRPPATTAPGALLTRITGDPLAAGASFQPMNVIPASSRRSPAAFPKTGAEPPWSHAHERTSAAPEKSLAPPAGDA